MRPPLGRAIVVGASSGIGEAVALELGREGARVALVARREGELQRVAAAMGAERGGGAPGDTAPASSLILVHDVTCYDEAPAVFGRAIAALAGRPATQP